MLAPKMLPKIATTPSVQILAWPIEARAPVNSKSVLLAIGTPQLSKARTTATTPYIRRGLAWEKKCVTACITYLFLHKALPSREHSFYEIFSLSTVSRRTTFPDGYS